MTPTNDVWKWWFYVPRGLTAGEVTDMLLVVAGPVGRTIVEDLDATMRVQREGAK